MAGFVGRARELKLLADLSTSVASGSRTGRPGKALLIRGRRRVGKSRLVEEFVERSGLPSVYFTAVGGSYAQDLAGFAAAIAESDLPQAHLATDFGAPQTWDAALSMLAQVLPTDTPSVVVLD